MDRTVPAGAALSNGLISMKGTAMDKYHVYRPVLDLLGRSEGTDKGDGYNETLGYGIMLDGRVSKGKGTDVVLTRMTLDQVDQMQTRMLKDPDNSRLNSSASGRYQIVRTTMRAIRTTLGLTGSERFDRDMQDRMACYLLGLRGIDKWLAGRLHIDTLLLNLSKEWASLPTPAGKGFYDGQRASVSVDDVKRALREVRLRHMEGQPKQVEKVPVPRPTVPHEVDEEVKQKTGLWGWLTTILGGGAPVWQGCSG
ncbi:membrane protein [Nitratireductor pacificus]|uniref:Transmembrane protein n=1 Tax=Nitratireductor pacificus pht-3B TaxID=391937 RepID=K2M7F3_9HYPH|nr:membrane protein [Nitratireductor pacificus]EKF16940.1 transmembrane protein [Nitratireductor pacificus pht-3B]